MKTKLERLEALQNYPTRYELVAERGDIRILMCYSMNTGRRAINDTCFKRVQELATLVGQPAEALLIEWRKPVKLGARIYSKSGGNEWSIKWSGRTQRDAISNGELPFIGNPVELQAVLAPVYSKPAIPSGFISDEAWSA